MGATPIDSVDITEVLMRKESLIPDRTACAIQAHAVRSVWEMNLNCWMLPLATYCHIHYHFTHSTLCCSSSNSWLLNKIQQKYSGTFTGCLETCDWQCVLTWLHYGVTGGVTGGVHGCWHHWSANQERLGMIQSSMQLLKRCSEKKSIINFRQSLSWIDAAL